MGFPHHFQIQWWRTAPSTDSLKIELRTRIVFKRSLGFCRVTHREALRRAFRPGLEPRPGDAASEPAALGPAAALYGRAGGVLSSAERRPEAAA